MTLFWEKPKAFGGGLRQKFYAVVLVDSVGEKQKGLLKTVVGRGSAEFGGQSQISYVIMHISFF